MESGKGARDRADRAILSIAYPEPGTMKRELVLVVLGVLLIVALLLALRAAGIL